MNLTTVTEDFAVLYFLDQETLKMTTIQKTIAEQMKMLPEFFVKGNTFTYI